MAVTPQQCSELTRLLSEAIETKLRKYKRETLHMPFHEALLGADRIASYSLTHSIVTSLGQSVFEQFAGLLAQPRFKVVQRQYKGLSGRMSSGAPDAIGRIVDDLTSGRSKPDKSAETRRVLTACEGAGTSDAGKPPRVDLYLEDHLGTEYYIDLKSPKPNRGEFTALKRVLLEWIAMRGTADPQAKVQTLLGIPYNPYSPEPYARWTALNLFDPAEILVAEDFWDFVGGAGTYPGVLAVFEEVGRSLQLKIEAAFGDPAARRGAGPPRLDL